jgi:hypothetical protein
MMQLMENLLDSLKREMHQGFASINARLDRMETRLDRHGALLQTGSRWTTPKIHLVAVGCAGDTDSRQNLCGFTIHFHIHRRDDRRRRI